jgi:hypothetical protein
MKKSPGKPAKANGLSFAFICFHLFFGIVVFQWVAADSNKNFSSSNPRLSQVPAGPRRHLIIALVVLLLRRPPPPGEARPRRVCHSYAIIAPLSGFGKKMSLGL